jgi:hypothetical protein
MNVKKWTKIKSRCINNLHLLEVDGRNVGTIYKNRDTKFDKNAWVIIKGVGDHTTFLGHAWKKSEAMEILERVVG